MVSLSHPKTCVYAFKLTDLQGDITFLGAGDFIVYRNPDTGELHAIRNKCRHQGGRFLKKEGGCVLTCGNHGWCLDVSRMLYTQPTGIRITQDEFLVEVTDDGTVRLFEAPSDHPWDIDPVEKLQLAGYEFTIRFYAHACVEIQCGTKRLVTDPWLIGPAFTRGWWLMHEPPSDWLERIASADAIYISHSHPDHLNVHTLKRLASVNPNIAIVLPQFEQTVCERIVKGCGFTNITCVPFATWTPFGVNGRFMILPDGTSNDDSALFIEYKGHRVLNVVDCTNANRGIIPSPVDVVMRSFGGGATGYPVCWGELYSEQTIRERIYKNRKQLALRVAETVKQTQAEVFIPIASYFVEAHPADAQIRRLNTKNTPQEIAELIGAYSPNTQTWIPEPGGIFDISTRMATPPVSSQPATITYDFDQYLSEIANDAAFPPLQDMHGIKEYFRWASFYDNVVLHVIETSEDFNSVLREFYVDLLDLTFPEARPQREHHYIRMRVRSDVFRHVLRQGLPWDEITIGFQARLYRDPDIYNLGFWDHFRNKLPAQAPWTE